MNRLLAKTLGCFGVGLLGSAAALGQADWDFQCIDPGNLTPYSNPFGVTGLLSDLMGVAMGVTGTVTYGDNASQPNGDDNLPCYTTTQTVNVVGRFGFMVGNRGSVQDENPSDVGSSFRDDLMMLTWGMPSPGGSGCYASTSVDGARTRFGSNGINLLFTGLSNRYFRCQSANGDVRITLTVSVVGDAVQMSWLLENTSTTASHNVGLWFGATMAMLSNFPDVTGSDMSHFFPDTPPNTAFGKLGYTVLSSGGRPPVTEHRFRRALNPSGFPQVVDYLFGQTAGYGMRVENGPTLATSNNSGSSDATEVSEFVQGQAFFLLGREVADNNFPDIIFPPIDPNDPDLGSDVLTLDNSGFIQKFPETAVGPGSFKRITHYIRSTWGNSNYSAPYAAVVDAPRLVAEDPTSLNGLRPNAMTIRVYVDNVGGYATVNQEVPINNVRVTLNLPPGLAVSDGPNERVIPTIPAREIGFVDFAVEADGVEFGDLPYSVRIEPTPGPTKVLTGTIRVASTPRLVVKEDANLVGSPWTFQDTALNTILSPLQAPTDFQAFKWDAEQQGYVVATSVERGVGFWLLSNDNHDSLPLGGNPIRPLDTATGGHLIQLKSGWNLIANPYNYAIRVGELVGVAAANPEQSFPWAQLVNQGFVSGALAYYDNAAQDYVFTSGFDSPLQPNRGYWIYVGTLQDVTLSFPAVYDTFLPGSLRSQSDTRWVQSDRQWRLKLAARTNKSIDAENHVGLARNATEATRLRIMEPPISPVHNVELSIKDIRNGKESRLAQSLAEGSGRKEWSVSVFAKDAGTVHLTWPNLSTVPKNVKFRLTDTATGKVTNLRQISSYSFEAAAESTREFKVEALPGGEASRATIGNVAVARNGRGPSADFVINYTLTADASTTVRILSGAGREVFAVARGRADKAGENSAVWTLKDNANRTVAPGAYRVEIIAETSTGDRVRRVVPINVIR